MPIFRKIPENQGIRAKDPFWALSPIVSAAMGQLTHLNEGSLANKHLVDVEQDVAAFDDHSLDRQVLADVFRFGHLQSNGNINKLVKYFRPTSSCICLDKSSSWTLPYKVDNLILKSGG